MLIIDKIHNSFNKTQFFENVPKKQNGGYRS